jgi:ribosome-binding protein aMBF1 (putative translation factor)
MTTPHHTDAPPVCDCCGRRVSKTTVKPITRSEAQLCMDCYAAWYEGDGYTHENTQDPELIKAAVLLKHGAYGGAANLTAPLLRWYDEREALKQRLRTAIDALYHLNDADVEDIADTLAQIHLEL